MKDKRKTTTDSRVCMTKSHVEPKANGAHTTYVAGRFYLVAAEFGASLIEKGLAQAATDQNEVVVEDEAKQPMAPRSVPTPGPAVHDGPTLDYPLED